MIPNIEEVSKSSFISFFNKIWDSFPKAVQVVLGILIIVSLIGGGIYYITLPSKSKIFTISGILIGKTSSKKLENIEVSLEQNSLIRDNTVREGVFELPNVTIPKNKLITLVVTYPDSTTDFVERIDLTPYEEAANSNNIIDIGTRRVKDLPTKSVNPKTDNKVPFLKSQPQNGENKNINNSKIEGSTIIQADKVFINSPLDTAKKK